MTDQTLPKSETEEVEEGMLKAGDVHRSLCRKLDPRLWHTALAGPEARQPGLERLGQSEAMGVFISLFLD